MIGEFKPFPTHDYHHSITGHYFISRKNLSYRLYVFQDISRDVIVYYCRQPLPRTWRGLRDDCLSNESGIEGGVFVHLTGFIGGNRSKEGAIAMAAKAIQLGSQVSKRVRVENEEGILYRIQK